MKACLTVIPARLGSTRFPRKVLARLSGRSMVEWCWRSAVAAGLGPVLVAVDSREVSDEVRRFGGTAVMTPRSCRSGSDRVWLAARGRREPIILNYQGDMPLLRPETLRSTVKALSRGVDIATAVIPLGSERRADDPNVVKAVLSDNGRCLYFTRAKAPSCRDGRRARRWEHLGLYAYRREALRRFVSLPPSALEKTERLEQLRALEAGMVIHAAVVDEPPVAVDVPADLRNAERLLRRGKK
ncbi:MAG: 3-deoxy-D-manno-octulosonate cytidylyltransferase [Elusimicrobia bacterium RBG_16_66_12]|nr:MAG: 3-deoxy-D-manno-octulosonate cytidylyltransferase [Elusimicrobia bacterium RBG_16_66_12]